MRNMGLAQWLKIAAIRIKNAFIKVEIYLNSPISVGANYININN